MNERPDRQRISRLIASAATRSGPNRRELAATLSARCWPGGSDGRNAVAAEWLRRWRPKPAVLVLPHCVCPAGHCEACN